MSSGQTSLEQMVRNGPVNSKSTLTTDINDNDVFGGCCNSCLLNGDIVLL